MRVEYFPGFTTLQLTHEVQELLLGLGETPENFTGRIIFMAMFIDISGASKDNKRECESMFLIRFSICKKIRSRTMVIPRSRFRGKVVFYQ